MLVRVSAVCAAVLVMLLGVASSPVSGAGVHDSPSRQLLEGVFPSDVQCNGPRELYLRNSQDLLCLYGPTYEALVQRGTDLVLAKDARGDPHIVTIGMLAPVTGGAAGYGQDINEAFMLALDDFNAQLEEDGQTWRLAASAHDTETSKETTMEKMRKLGGDGVRIVAGPSIDTFDTDVIAYAAANDMLLFSCCSEAHSKSAGGDPLFRMIADQSVRAGVLADFVAGTGIKTIVPVSRADEWATGTISFAAERFAESGGQAADHIEYDPDGTFGDSHMSALADSVREALASADPSEVAVLYVGFEETYDFIEAASAYDTLSKVRWFGSDANTVLHENAAGLEFAEQVGFTVIEPAFHDGRVAADVTARLSAIEGRQPSIYAMFAYDVVSILGRAINEARTSNPADVIPEIARTSAGYVGASGEGITFDSAGDRTHIEYAFFEIVDGEWIETSRHGAESGAASPLDLTEAESAYLDAGTVRFTYDPGWAPIEYRDGSGNVAGLAKTYVEEFERLTGADLEQVDAETWDGALGLLRDGGADVVFMVAATPDRYRYLDFTTTHTTLSTDIVSIGEQSYTADDLAGLKAVTVLNHAIEAWLDDYHPDVSYVSANSTQEGLAMIQSGQADVLLDVFDSVSYHADNSGIEVYNAGPTGHAYELRIGYAKGMATLGSILQKAQDIVSPPVTIRLDLTDEEAAYLDANAVRFTYDPGWAPIEYRDGSGNVAGLTGKYVTEFERLTGAELEQVNVDDWDGVLDALIQGDADTAFMIVDTQQRRAEMNLDFTAPHTTVSTDIVSIGEQSYTADDLAGLKAVTIRDYAIETWLDENRPDVEYVSVGSFEEGLQMLQAGQADVFLDRFETIAYHAGGPDGLHNSGPTGHAYELSIAYDRDNRILGSILQKVQDAVSGDVVVP